MPQCCGITDETTEGRVLYFQLFVLIHCPVQVQWVVQCPSRNMYVGRFVCNHASFVCTQY